jgi:oxygen-independent coproporphyrinogen-3 oxidase
MSELIEKYNTAAPRYTSYPTVPYWDTIPPEQKDWKQLAKQTFMASNNSEGISLYIHLPFCESLCTYCGCNTRITVNHKVETPYIKAVLKEWSLYLALFEFPPRIKEIHLGGGTPTFFSAVHLKQLIEGIISTSILCDEAELSFEAHPANTTREHLATLYGLGFRRISLGIQDFDPKVQHIINRMQSYGDVERITAEARRIGYTSINYDLIYGLPLQTEESMARTIEKVIRLHPDRIAFYSYAHVPWLKPGQRKFTEADLPEGSIKRILYENGRKEFENAGYVEIGMDHFALPDDPLYLAEKKGTLHRNFMGYTTSHTQLLVGLGVSSISDSWNGFIQNEKKVEDYYKKIDAGVFPFFKGHLLSSEDLVLRQHILNIMCRQETSWKETQEQCESLYQGAERLKELESDGLIRLSPFQLSVKKEGKPFLRNICMALDAKLWAKQPEIQLFSKTI